MKYAVIGAGISGLSIANLLKENNEVVVFEACDRPGGMIKCDLIDGNLFHRTGGHVFNTKREDVMQWFWSFFDKEKEYTKAIRNSSVFMPDGKKIPYPIENHAYLLDKQIGRLIVKDIIKMIEGRKEPSNFEEFLKERFGDTLYDIYFKPYNEKVWRRDLTKVPLSWLEGKLPMPTVEEIIYNNIYHIEEKAFVHSSFYYPIKGGSQFIADTFSKRLDIRLSKKIENIEKTKEGKLLIKGEEFDRVIFCGNIKQLPSLLANTIDVSGFTKAIDNLEFHGTTSVFCEIDSNPYSWIYMPGLEHESHRIICTGNFSVNNNAKGKMTGTIEFTDYISEEDIKDNLSRIPLHPQYITHNFEKYTYPIQDTNTRSMISSLKDILQKNNIYLCGRFAEWEYANMDICMGYAINLARKL